MAAGSPSCADDFFPAGVRLAEANVVFNGVGEQIDILENHADLIHQVLEGVRAHIVPANGDAAALYIPEASDEVAEGCLAAAAWANDGAGAAIRDGQRDIVQHRLVLVGEIHMVENDGMILRLEGACAIVHLWNFVDLVSLIDGACHEAQSGDGTPGRLNLGKYHKSDDDSHERISQVQRPSQVEPHSAGDHGHRKKMKHNLL